MPRVKREIAEGLEGVVTERNAAAGCERKRNKNGVRKGQGE